MGDGLIAAQDAGRGVLVIALTRALRCLTEDGSSAGNNFLVVACNPARNFHVQFLSSVGSAVVLGEAVSDTVVGEKPPWRQRKEKYLEHLQSVLPEVLLVSAADKLYNARTILADYRSLGEALWSRFNAPRDEILWYYESLVRIFRRRGPASLVRDMDSVVRTLLYLVRRYDTRHQSATVDLRQAMAPFERELDDPSAEFLLNLRAAGALRDADWTHMLAEIPAALRFLAGPSPTLTSDERGQAVLDPDADPRNADWLRLAAAARKARHDRPLWSAMWLWHVGHNRGASFWDGVARVAEQMQFPRRGPDHA